MSDETSRKPDTASGGDSTPDSPQALPTRRSLRNARSAAATGATAGDATASPVEPAVDAAEPAVDVTEVVETVEVIPAAGTPDEPAVMVDIEPAVDPNTGSLPSSQVPVAAPVPTRARLAARVAATPPTTSARSVPRQSRWKSIRSMLIVAIAVPGIFGTVALPAYAFTSEESAAVAPIHDTGAQSLTVANWSRPALARDGYSATSAEELRAAEAAKAAAEAAKKAAKLAAGRANSSAGGYVYNANDTDLSAFLATRSSTWIKPLNAGISSHYGPRGLICNGAGCSNSFHDGVDFGAGCGTPIKAVSAGRVTFTGSGGAYGQRVIVDHGGGVESIYGHVQSGSFKVSVGQLVEAGTVVASVGATGVVSGCHLDLKIRLGGNFTNPVPYLAARGVNL